jgi:hypothetical protein
MTRIFLAIISLLTFGMIPGPRDARAAENDTAAIVNSGSTNRPGFRIVVDRSGAAEFTPTRRRRALQPDEIRPVKMTIPRALTERFYADLKAATPFASLPATHCMKSVSFGSTLVIGFGGEQTPDLSCGDGGNAVVGNLIRDCNEIVAVFQGQ